MDEESTSSNSPTEPFVKKGKDDTMNSKSTNSNGVTFSAGDHSTVLHAIRLFNVRKSELTPLAMRLAKDTATTVFMSEFKSKVIASKKKRNSKRFNIKTTVH